MTGEIYEFDAPVGGGYRMPLFYRPDERASRSKTFGQGGRGQRAVCGIGAATQIIEAVNFVTTDPAFFGEMTLIATFEAVSCGTEVTLVFEKLPPGLRARTTRSTCASVWNSWPDASNDRGRNCLPPTRATQAPRLFRPSAMPVE